MEADDAGASGGYAGAVIAMGTMHGKERQVAPPFADVLGARVVAPPGIDTDQFGTFTGEVARTSEPPAAATAKARLAMRALGVPYGLASEASYDAWLGVLAVHEEILVFVDDVRGIRVVEGLRTPGAPGPPRLVHGADDAVDAARGFGFPRQGAAVKAAVEDRVRVFGKGITDPATLVEVVGAALAVADGNRAWVEPDLRAHHNPSRRDVLAALAGRLARRLATPCPGCKSPGYGKVAVREGLPCRACGCPTTLAAADVHGCPTCMHRSAVARSGAGAEPRFCPACNP
ncbi:DUF6671 family protein [Mycobacterium helveticum]|uniref:DUF6671 domain-containing protein n=1 Tax=Mycobacterium helveticum TaxID=2592811 RepID=A0A557XZ11_9MYCO|nr:DUF6671 family protein [Mycobacterium helveticum]TVS89494.1 hypothetical protein FPZ46_02525 [Mycobacterium helveticum]TVS91438.1 hypothetical protein FPZ47_05105 [Mycobacterium helveticum]